MKGRKTAKRVFCSNGGQKACNQEKENHVKGRKTTPAKRSFWTNKFLISNLKRSIRSDFGSREPITALVTKMVTNPTLMDWGIQNTTPKTVYQIAKFTESEIRYHLSKSREATEPYLAEVQARIEEGVSRSPEMHSKSNIVLIEELTKCVGYYPRDGESGKVLNELCFFNSYVETTMRNDEHLAVLKKLDAKCFAAVADWISDEVGTHFEGSRRRLQNSLAELQIRMTNKMSRLIASKAGTLASI